MASGTKIRALTRLLDASAAPVWVIGADGKLVYLSAAVGRWVGVDVQSLEDRRSIAGSPASDDPLDQLAAALAPPPGLTQHGTAALRMQLPPLGQHQGEPIEARFVRVGTGEDAFTLAVAGHFSDQHPSLELRDAVAIRSRLDAWRKRHASFATTATVGDSTAARRLRRRLKVAAATRTDIGFFGPAGCGSETIAARVHGRSAPGEPLVDVDGSLMDAELLDATLMPLLGRLADSSTALATALIRGLDEMPLDAQARLTTLHNTYEGRLRILATCQTGTRIKTDQEQLSALDRTLVGMNQQTQRGILAPLAEILSSLSVSIQPLATRVEDIPLLATALLNNRRAAGEGSAERFSRAALDALVLYPWPGDFWELDAAVRQAVRTASGQSIAPENLPLAVRSYRPGQPSAGRQPPAASLDEAVRRYELRLINEAVQAAEGNRAEAARRLGISRARLLRRLDDGAQEDDAAKQPRPRPKRR